MEATGSRRLEDWGHHQSDQAREEAALAGAAVAAAAIKTKKKTVPFQNPFKGTCAMQEGQNTEDD